ncbi:MAG TPA: hypothetical protein PLP64_04080 [Pseudothermotoga sp.]|nr:hypothetical protein [Pseudothermotoga sp.]HOK83387.1 hypothetical protein [Pseudothermotoga sp.]HPP71180.1 hypothetical protein [Pseudothermotoga sp.]
MQSWMEKYVTTKDERKLLKQLLQTGEISDLESTFGDDFVRELIENSEHLESYGDYEILKFADEGKVRLIAIGYERKHGIPYVVQELILDKDEYSESSIEELKELIDSDYVEEDSDEVERLVDIDEYEDTDDYEDMDEYDEYD